MIDSDDVQLQIKKKARRRLVGAVAFAAFAALVLPLIMDQEPVPPAQEVEIRIPGQDQAFQPALAPMPHETAAHEVDEGATPVPPVVSQTPSAVAAQPVPAPAPVHQNVARVIETVPAGGTAQAPAEVKPEPRPAARPEPKPEAKQEAKQEAKPEPKQVARLDADAEARRAAAILAGQTPEPKVETRPAATGQHVILIGAFANEGNVRNIRTKLGELGIKTFTEPLDSPQGRKTRVRAGPFANREAADKALAKMQRIGVSGVVAAK